MTADMLNKMLDDECIRRGLPLFKHKNKTGTRVIVDYSSTKEAEADQNSNQKEAEEASDEVQWTASSSTKLIDEMFIRNGWKPPKPVEKKGSGVIIPSNSSEKEDK